LELNLCLSFNPNERNDTIAALIGGIIFYSCFETMSLQKKDMRIKFRC
jgi:hypothetical protein